MIISRLHNDVLKKKVFWTLFSENHSGNFKHTQTLSRDINTFKMECFFGNEKILFSESDSKPLVCDFDIDTDKSITLEIAQAGFIDKLYSFISGKEKKQKMSFVNKFMVKSNNKLILNSIINDKKLIEIIDKSEFSVFYAVTEKNLIKARLTSSYFVDDYKKLSDIFVITCKIIEHLKL